MPSYLCPKCKTRLERKERHFHWRGQFFYGQVCVPCNALFDDPEDSFWLHVTGQTSKGPKLELAPDPVLTLKIIGDNDPENGIFTRGYWHDEHKMPVREENDDEFRTRIKATNGKKPPC